MIDRFRRLEDVDDLPAVATVLGESETEVPSILLAVVEREKEIPALATHREDSGVRVGKRRCRER